MCSEKGHLPACRRAVAVLDGEVLGYPGHELLDRGVVGSVECLRVEEMRAVTGLADDPGLRTVLDVADQGIFLVFFPFFRPIEFILDLHRETENGDLDAGVLLEMFGDHNLSIWWFGFPMCQQGGKRYRPLWLNGAVGGSKTGEHAETVQGKLRHRDAHRAVPVGEGDLPVIQPEDGIPAHQPESDPAVEYPAVEVVIEYADRPGIGIAVAECQQLACGGL
ncbi:hypothetical protein CHT99_01320 [Sphingobacterium cellulitidis]|nr:hypothetical protein CHT99_01320 [Sphingobacterium cellulitidis]